MHHDVRTAGERGLAFERRLARLFEHKGYEVVHDSWLTGRSGARHQVDVLARHAAPLHTSMILVETKAYGSAVDKDRIMKLIHIVQDTGADRGIIVTTSHFTPDAIKTSAGHCIDLWNRETLTRLLGEIEIGSLETGAQRSYHVVSRGVQPAVDIDALKRELERATERRSKGTFGMGKVVETLTDIRPVFYPYFEIELETRAHDTQRVGLFKKEAVTRTLTTRVTFDALNGTLVTITHPSAISYEWQWLQGLSADELAVMTFVRGQTFTLAGLATLTVPDARKKRAIAALCSRAAITATDDRPSRYHVVRPVPDDPLSLPSLSDARDICAELDAGGAGVIPAVIESSAIAAAVEMYWPGSRVAAVSLVHHPFVRAVFRRPDESIRTQTFDGVTGEEHPSVDRMLDGRLAP